VWMGEWSLVMYLLKTPCDVIFVTLAISTAHSIDLVDGSEGLRLSLSPRRR